LSSSRRPITTRRIKNLVNKALNDGPEWGPSKGYKYLKDISLGSKFKTGSVEGILLDVNKSAARVLSLMYYLEIMMIRSIIQVNK